MQYEQRFKTKYYIEVKRYYTERTYIPGESRGDRVEPTREEQVAVNDRHRAEYLRMLIDTNFGPGDILLTLTERNRDATFDEIKSALTLFQARVRRLYRKHNIVLKSLYVYEIGSRGARHVHMLLSNIPDTRALAQCWNRGYTDIKHLDDTGQYEGIAAYFVKYYKKTREYFKRENRTGLKRWYSSRNLAKPDIKKRPVYSRHVSKSIGEAHWRRRGYILDKDSVRSGICEYNGQEFFEFRVINQHPDKPPHRRRKKKKKRQRGGGDG